MLVVAVVDLFVLSASFMGAYWLRFNVGLFPERPIPSFEMYLRFSLLVGLIGVLILHASGVYSQRRLSLRVHDFTRILRGSILTAGIVTIASFMLRGVVSRTDLELYSRLIIATSGILMFVGLIGWRLAFLKLVAGVGGGEWGSKRLLVLGVNPRSERFCRNLERDRSGYELLGRLSENEARSSKDGDWTILGTIDGLDAVLREMRVDEVLAVLDDATPDLVSHLRDSCARAEVGFRLMPDVASLMLSGSEVIDIAGFPVFAPRDERVQRWNRHAKRGIDLVVAVGLMIITVPLSLALAALVKMSSRGPVVFRQERVGKNQITFEILKFRTMYLDAEPRVATDQTTCGQPEVVQAAKRDPRVTRIGRLMRRFSLDELPQIVNVLKGEMSFVGPRPHIPGEVAQYREWQTRKFDVLPGVTGLTQVSGRKDLSLDDMLMLDIYYIETWSVWLDLKILLQTVPIVLYGRGAY